jgi:hypothetical protein
VLKTTVSLIPGHELQGLAEGTIQRILSDIPGVTIESIDQPTDRNWDFEVRLKSEAGRQILLCETKSRAWPNELYSILHRFTHSASRHDLGRWKPVLVAPYVSSQAGQLCAELGLSWADFAGNCDLRIEGAYVKIQGIPNPYKRGRGTASLYSPRSANVVHALLLNPHRSWTMPGLAKDSAVSLGQVANVKKLLEANAWIRVSYGDTVLTEPRKLLEDWSIHYQPKRKTIRMFTLDKPHELEQRIIQTFSDYAFTEFSASERYAPYTRQQRVAFYVPNWTAERSAALGLKDGDGAANVTVYETGEGIPFVQPVNGARCVSPLIAYLDLRQLAGRGQDAADRLLDSVIEPSWK